jgi:hypothetical protein
MFIFLEIVKDIYGICWVNSQIINKVKINVTVTKDPSSGVHILSATQVLSILTPRFTEEAAEFSRVVKKNTTSGSVTLSILYNIQPTVSQNIRIRN